MRTDGGKRDCRSAGAITKKKLHVKMGLRQRVSRDYGYHKVGNTPSVSRLFRKHPTTPSVSERFASTLAARRPLRRCPATRASRSTPASFWWCVVLAFLLCACVRAIVLGPRSCVPACDRDGKARALRRCPATPSPLAPRWTPAFGGASFLRFVVACVRHARGEARARATWTPT